MKFLTSLSFFIFATLSTLHAQKIPGEVESTWPGIHFQVVEVSAIPGNRLIVVVRVVATAQAPKNGTLIGTQPPIPPDATPRQIADGLFSPIPFSLEPSVMIDEKTKQEYPALKPGPDDNYLPGERLFSLHPLQAEKMAVLFTAPPPQFDSEGHPVKQTVSIILPKAKGPISKITIPLPLPTPGPATH